MIKELFPKELKLYDATLETIQVDADDINIKRSGYATIFGLKGLRLHFTDCDITLGQIRRCQQIRIHRKVDRVVIEPDAYEVGSVKILYANGDKLEIYISE